MNGRRNLLISGLVLLLAGGLAACGGSEEPVTERAAQTGKEIGQAMDKLGEKTEQAVDKIEAKTSQQVEKTGAVLDDVEITTRVKAAIFAEPGLKTLQISVDTVNGVVTLSGSVDSQPDSDTAQSLAGAVAGVREVQNRLVVKP